MLEVKETHDCKTPDMSLPDKTVEVPYSILGFKRVRKYTYKCFDKREAKWTCPVCESKWHYTGAYGQYGEYGGRWECTKRTEVWEKVPV